MKFADLGHVRLRYAQRPARGVVAGTREHVLLIHGLASNVGLWFFRIAPKLAAHYQVTMLDLPGHGRSSPSTKGYKPADIAEDIGQFMDHLGIEKAHLVGHSFGGAVAMKFTHLYGSRVRSVTLVDSRLRELQGVMPVSGWEHWPRYKKMINKFGVDIDERTPDFGFDVLVAMARLRIQSPEKSEQLSKILPISLLGSGGVPAARRWLDLVENPDVREDLTNGEDITMGDLLEIHTPAAGVYGGLSPNIGTAEKLQLMWPHVNIKVVPQVGHFFTDSHPSAIIDSVDTLIKRVTRLPDSSVGY